MKFTDVYIRRPVLATTISLLIVLLGLQALKGMQIRQYPMMTNTVITVTTGYYGASSELIQGFITQPLEQAIAQADNIDFMTSQSFLGSSVITIYMKLNTNPDGAVANILAKVNSVRSKLPQEAEDPSIDSSTGASSSLIYIAFSSDTINGSQITDYLERVVQPQLFTINGVAKVNLNGGSNFAMRIWLDPQKMASHGLNATEVLQILRDNNYQSAPGQVVGYFTQLDIEAETQIQDVESLEKLVVAENNGALVLLRDIAEVSMEKSHDTIRAQANGNNAVIVSVDPTPTANPLEITAAVRAMLPDIEKNKPSSIDMAVVYDSTLAIHESIDEVIKTLVEATLIVLVVIILFLGSLRAAAIPIITIPLSLIGVIMVMSAVGFSINLMTLLAMVLAIGLVVDDAIVVLENVDRHIKEGETPFRAAIIGTREIALPVISMTITLAAVYTPIALMGGITGSLFKEFALTLAGAVFISGIIALTLSPMLSSKILKENVKPGRFEAFIHGLLERLTKAYGRFLGNILNHRFVVLVFAVIVFMSLPVLFTFIPAELAPKEDQGAFLMIGKAPSNANLDYIEPVVEAATKELKSREVIEAVIGFSGVPSGNQSMGVGILVPWSEREVSQHQVQSEFSDYLKNVPEMSISAFGFPELPGASSGLPIQFVINTSNDFSSLFQVASEILIKVNNNPMFVFSDLDLTYDSGVLKIHIIRDKAGVYGVNMADIAITLSGMMSDAYINRINLLGRSYEVIPQVIRENRLTPDALANYYVRSINNQMIPLSSLVEMEVISKPRTLTHYNQMNSATISAVAAPGNSIGDAVSFFKDDIARNLPSGYNYDFLGESRQYVQEGNALYGTFMLAFFVVYLVLAAQFESLRDPLVILVSVPLALSGALVVLAWGASSMNIYSQVGLITLMGLISKHGILICEVARENQLNENMDRMAAVKHAAEIRLRPILMTTAAMVAGLIPLMFASGAGAESRFSIGVVIVAGLSLGTIFTLFVLPVIYTFLASVHQALPEFDED
ncbi:MAG: multidrug efflux RND transporter permease subunit [Gammaproteobacteria bacterium]|nr:multidrug efflux RND transporter permease subunit [Gammaproteobacteria bacterium]